MEDIMVELRRFTLVSEAEILANLLKSEGVNCYVRDCFINQIYSGVDFGGVKIELLEKDLQRAKEIMSAFGYGESEESEESEENGENGESGESWGNGGNEENGGSGEYEEADEKILAEYERKRAELSRTMTVISILIVILIGILIFLNKYFNG